MNYYDALYKLYPFIVSTHGDKAFDANGNEVEIDKQLIEAEMVKTAYIEKRAAEYPSIVEQLDMIFHGGIEQWKAQIQAIKDKYPKS